LSSGILCSVAGVLTNDKVSTEYDVIIFNGWVVVEGDFPDKIFTPFSCPAFVLYAIAVSSDLIVFD
jgi:hypothetical protein